MDLILAIDQGTSSTRVLAFNLCGDCILTEQITLTQYYPHNGWVEHCAEEIYSKTSQALKKVLVDTQILGGKVVCVGITNQRETTVLWDKKNSKPVGRAIVWQDRRTSEYCASLSKHQANIQNKTGLLVDPYFSATKIKWLLDNNKEAHELLKKNELAFGTIDSYLIWCLTDGTSHKTDVTNASRTMLYNINDFSWDPDLLALFKIPLQILPEIENCDALFGLLSEKQFACNAPITGVVGDQQAASIGQFCFSKYDAKMTFGTGAFLMVNTGMSKMVSDNLLATVAYKTKTNFSYALEGSIFHAGTIVNWLRDQLSLFSHASESETLAQSVSHNGGVYLIPAFTGLGAPHWQAELRGMLLGLQLDSKASHIVRAGLEAIAYQAQDLLEVLRNEFSIKLKQLYVDGGVSANQWLMQFIANLTECTVIKPKQSELTALGAAMMAGIGAGLFKDFSAYVHWNHLDWQKEAGLSKKKEYKQWLDALKACKMLHK